MAEPQQSLAERIRAYADILARGSGSVPAGDVAWKLRQILGDQESDAEVIASAPVKLRDHELVRAKRRLFSHIFANAHLLDVPYTDAPDQTPWTRIKPVMRRLDAEIAKALGVNSDE